MPLLLGKSLIESLAYALKKVRRPDGQHLRFVLRLKGSDAFLQSGDGEVDVHSFRLELIQAYGLLQVGAKKALLLLLAFG